tara:strand:- start:1054 stop:1365 length:312 start_codon:yes stop_codon:yes gene_type:complete
MKTIEILFDSIRGKYIPNHFLELLENDTWKLPPNVDTDYVKNSLKNDDSDDYWIAWEQVLEHAFHIDKSGDTWLLHHDGDLFAYNENKITDEDYDNLTGTEGF